MDFIHHSKVNPEIVNQLEESHAKVKFEDPVFDHHERLEKYVDTLEHEDENIRESMIKQWLEPILKRVIGKWKSKFSYNSNIIQNAMSEKAVLQEERHNNEQKIAEIEAEMKKTEFEKDDVQTRIEHKNDKLVDGKINWKAERLKVRIFIPAALLIAFFSFFSYLDSSKDLFWLNAGLEDRKGLIEDVAFNDNGQVKSKYKSYFDLEIDEDSNERLFSWNDHIVEAAGSGTLNAWQYIAASDGIGLIMALSAVVLLLGGKIISIVYERLGYNNRYFYIISSLAMLVVIAGIFLGTASKGGLATVNDITKQISTLNAEKVEIEEYLDPDELEPGNEPNNLKAIRTEIKTKKQNLELAKNDANSIKSINTLIIFIAEVLVGGIAWMVLADFHHKETLSNGGAEGLIQNLSVIRESKTDKIAALFQNRKLLIEENVLAAGLISRLGALLADIESTSDIEAIADSYKRQEVSYAVQLLSAAKHRWKTKAIQV